MAQLAERLLPIPAIRGSILFTVEKTKINKKRPGLAHFLTLLK